MSRVILLAGHGGAGTSTLAAATADQVRDLGGRVALVDASGDPGQRGVEPSDPVVELVSGTLGRLLLDAGADPVVPQAWADLPGVALALAWQEIEAARRSADVVVVDAGSLLRVRELAALPGVLLRLLDAGLSPRTAMWRGPGGDGGLFESLSEARVRALAWQSLLTSDTTSLRLVARPESSSTETLLRTAGVLAMLGVRVEGVIVNRCPRRRDDAPRSVRAQVSGTLADLQAGLPGIPVWRSTSRLRPVPKGHAAADILAATGPEATLRDRDGAAGTLERDGDHYLLTVPLLPVVRDGARVGVQGDSLILAFDGVHAFVPLPPVLRRCVAHEARRTPGGLLIRWSPDLDVWPAERVS